MSVCARERAREREFVCVNTHSVMMPPVHPRLCLVNRGRITKGCELTDSWAIEGPAS